MALVVVVTSAVVCEVLFVVHGWCTRGGQVSEARLESTFLADDAACLTLDRAVIQLRCSEIVSLGCGRLFCVVVWFPQWNMGFGRVLFPQSHRIAHHSNHPCFGETNMSNSRMCRQRIRRMDVSTAR